MKLTKGLRKFILIVHILFSAIMVGNMATFVILSLTIATTQDAGLVKSCYTVMNILSHTSILASTIGATATGLVLAIFTHYGMFRFWWVMVKEALTILLIGIYLWGMYAWTLSALNNGAVSGYEAQPAIGLWAGIIIQIISLVLMFVISKFKPWGIRKR